MNTGSIRAIVLSLGLMICTVPVQGQTNTNIVAALSPQSRDTGWWKQRHQDKLALVEKGGYDLVFVGDSITHWFERSGTGVWNRLYAPRKALNLGYSGDRTEHVLWRLENGELKGLSPKVAVVMIGTNNSGHRFDKPEDIAAGIKAICDTLTAKMPEVKILLLAIFPQGKAPDDRLRLNNEKVNALIAALADGKRIEYLNINDRFVDKEGSIRPELMPDRLHPAAAGYEVWAEAMEPVLSRMLGQGQTKNTP